MKFKPPTYLPSPLRCRAQPNPLYLPSSSLGPTCECLELLGHPLVFTAPRPLQARAAGTWRLLAVAEVAFLSLDNICHCDVDVQLVLWAFLVNLF